MTILYIAKKNIYVYIYFSNNDDRMAIYLRVYRLRYLYDVLGGKFLKFSLLTTLKAHIHTYLQKKTHLTI